MSQPLNIEALLETGYFKTSRAKSIAPTSPGHITPPLSPTPRLRLDDDYTEDRHRYERALVPHVTHDTQRPLPPPLVEDEAESLAKEFQPPHQTSPDGDVPSRGEVDQHPVLLEVHEHNPERRFVIVPGREDDSDNKSSDTNSSSSQRPKVEALSDEPKAASQGRRYDPIIDEHLSAERPALNRRKSRQDLPPLDTRNEPDPPRRHHRTQSAAGPRPDMHSAQPSAQFRDDMLSPAYIKTGSSGREKTYSGYGVPTSASRSSRSNDHSRSDGRRRDTDPRRKSPSPHVGMRSESTAEPRRSRRRMSNASESYSREDSLPIRTGTRDSVSSLKRGDDDATPVPPPKAREPIRRRDGSRSSDESVASSKTSSRRRRASTLIHQEPEPIRGSERDQADWKNSHARPPPVPPHGKPIATTIDGTPLNPRSSATFPIAGTSTSSHLPYPDDDPMKDFAATTGLKPAHMPHEPSASMPDFPPPIAERVGHESPPSATNSNAPSSAWSIPAFDPVKDALPVDGEMGSYRRYSEGRAGNEFPGFPECQRKTPVAGKMDWLTLPRSDINICPDCYQGIFANSRFRTLFHPMLRPTDKPLSCDFGAMPWYRIAWLLTLKNDRPDLQLFHQVDNVISSSRNQPCPGPRAATRNWLTVKDPYKRRAVPNFTVCFQCAKTVEVLLPSLMGVFVPLDTREPLDSVCSLHYAPQRKRFALYFDTLETTADRALRAGGPPNVSELASRLERHSVLDECREDSPVRHRYWHTMQCIPYFTVCEECFTEVVRPRIRENEALARNFYREPERLKEAACQLYSPRMREIFRKACRRNDPKYLQDKVDERRRVEADIHAKLMKLDKMDKKGQADMRTVEEQVAKLIKEWKTWE